MPSMTKRVNIKAPVAIRTITPPIYGTCNNIIMTTGDILKCICKKAIVEEILPDGSTIRLNMRNYYTDNGAGLDAKKVEFPKKDEEKIPEAFVTGMIVIEDDDKVPEAPSEEAQVVETTITSCNVEEEFTVADDNACTEKAEDVENTANSESSESVTTAAEKPANTNTKKKSSNKKKANSSK